jgi:hypothetical protein
LFKNEGTAEKDVTRLGAPQILMTLLDSQFTSLQRSNGDGGIEHELYVVHDEDNLIRVTMRFGWDEIYPSRNAHPGDWPDDVHEAGETIGEALDREAIPKVKYVVLRARGVGRFGYRANEVLLAAQPEQLAHDLRLTAHDLWQQRGCPPGDGLVDWIAARKALGIPHDVDV